MKEVRHLRLEAEGTALTDADRALGTRGQWLPAALSSLAGRRGNGWTTDLLLRLCI